MNNDEPFHVGEKFGHLTIIKSAGVNAHYCKKVECLCDCGTRKVVLLSHVMSGSTKSCGCYRSKRASSLSRSHGLLVGAKKIEPRLYRIWSNMKARCFNDKHKAFKNYGARGIEVCRDWAEDYKVFHEWALLSGYSDSLTIERVDNDSGYSPENCKWVSKSEQVRNRRANKLTLVDAVKIRLAVDLGESRKSIAKRLGISTSHVNNIISHHRW